MVDARLWSVDTPTALSPRVVTKKRIGVFVGRVG